ncbi:MAG: hypothetical protein DI529_10795 [Chryseobacterium sp.]|nr:MAG: hypothetical protein DI529_10795 [Chryseobacterium sp.]
MTLAYTLVNIAYLPVAKTLADSFSRHNPDIPFYICLFDDQEDIKDEVFLNYNIYDKNKLDSDAYESMRSRYNNLGMACALKPFFGEQLIKEFSPDSIIYIDADVMVFDKFDMVADVFQNQGKSVILTAHNYKIVKNDKEVVFNIYSRKSGIYNAGFFAVKNDASGLEFLEWWKRMLFTACVKDDKNGVLYDQTWLDLVTVYFKDELFILDHLGYNVAFWNWQERNITRENDGKYYINQTFPLVFFHFARYNYYQPELLDGYSKRIGDYLSLKGIFDGYRSHLKSNLFENYITPRKTTVKDIPQKIKQRLKFYLENLADKL